jgi:hypothetical protein
VIVSLCRNPDGFLWAGDTAQTISIGSTFSFKELGAFVYRYQVCNSEVLYEKLTIFSEINPSSAWNPESPKGFQLLVNYRSHGGIVKCANAIIQLLQRFPGTIDVAATRSRCRSAKHCLCFSIADAFPSNERDFFLLSTCVRTPSGHACLDEL